MAYQQIVLLIAASLFIVDFSAANDLKGYKDGSIEYSIETTGNIQGKNGKADCICKLNEMNSVQTKSFEQEKIVVYNVQTWGQKQYLTETTDPGTIVLVALKSETNACKSLDNVGFNGLYRSRVEFGYLKKKDGSAKVEVKFAIYEPIN